MNYIGFKWEKMLCDSDDDPFGGTHTDSDEDYMPDTKKPKPKIHPGKKRLVRKTSWKRNIQKARRTKGEPYINVAGIHKPGKHIGSNCHCKLKCINEIGHESCEKIFRDFCAMASKDLQDAYLYGNIFKSEVQRARPRSGDGNKKNGTFTYKVIYYEEYKIIYFRFYYFIFISDSPQWCGTENLQKGVSFTAWDHKSET